MGQRLKLKLRLIQAEHYDQSIVNVGYLQQGRL